MFSRLSLVVVYSVLFFVLEFVKQCGSISKPNNILKSTKETFEKKFSAAITLSEIINNYNN